MALYMKLFFVVGILWIVDFIHILVHPNEHDHRFEIVFKIVDVLNALRGLFLFCIFICKKSVYAKLRKYFKSDGRGFSNSRGPIKSQSSKTSTSFNVSSLISR